VVVRDNTIEGGWETIIFYLKVPRHCPLVLLIRVRLEFRVNSTFLYMYIIVFYPWVLHPVAHLSNLVSYDAVNRNKVSIFVCKLSLFIFLPTHYMFRPLQAIFK
jgi:hypothetical protein